MEQNTWESLCEDTYKQVWPYNGNNNVFCLAIHSRVHYNVVMFKEFLNEAYYCTFTSHHENLR